MNEYKILEQGIDNKVLVEWDRGCDIFYKDGKEYSVHTVSLMDNLIWGHYFSNITDAVNYFSKYRKDDSNTLYIGYVNDDGYTFNGYYHSYWNDEKMVCSDMYATIEESEKHLETLIEEGYTIIESSGMSFSKDESEVM